MYILFHMLIVFAWGLCVCNAMIIRKKTKKAVTDKLIGKDEAIKKYKTAFYTIAVSTVMSGLLIRLITHLS